MVMPITSTKNLRLSSGFGVSSSRWPRWARSKIGSGCILVDLLNQRSSHIVEQLIGRKPSRNQALLRRVSGNALQRTPHLSRSESPVCRGGRFRQHAVDFTDDLGMAVGQFLGND